MEKKKKDQTLNLATEDTNKLTWEAENQEEGSEVHGYGSENRSGSLDRLQGDDFIRTETFPTSRTSMFLNITSCFAQLNCTT